MLSHRPSVFIAGCEVSPILVRACRVSADGDWLLLTTNFNCMHKLYKLRIWWGLCYRHIRWCTIRAERPQALENLARKPPIDIGGLTCKSLRGNLTIEELPNLLFGSVSLGRQSPSQMSVYPLIYVNTNFVPRCAPAYQRPSTLLRSS